MWIHCSAIVHSEHETGGKFRNFLKVNLSTTPDPPKYEYLCLRMREPAAICLPTGVSNTLSEILSVQLSPTTYWKHKWALLFWPAPKAHWNTTFMVCCASPGCCAQHAPILGLAWCWPNVVVQCAACPTRIRSEMQTVFRGVDTSKLLIIPTCQHSVENLVQMGEKIEDEKDRLLIAVSVE